MFGFGDSFKTLGETEDIAPPPPPVGNKLLLESGDKLLQEDGTSFILL